MQTETTKVEQPSSKLFSLPRNVWIVTLTSFLTDVSSQMLTSLIPLFLANVLGAQTSVIGLIDGVAETTASMLKVFSGWLSDKLGQRKWLAVAGYGLSTISKPFLYIASTWPIVLFVRFSERTGKGIRVAPRDALVADSIKPEQRGLAFGLNRAGDTAGGALGLIVALIVVWGAEKNSQMLTHSVFKTLVLLSIFPAVLAVIGLAVGAKETPIPKDKRQAPRFNLSQFDKRFKMFLVIMILFTLGNSSDSFLVLRAQNVGLTVAGVLGMMITFNIIYSVLSGPAGAFSDKVGRKGLIIGGWLIYGLIYLGFARISQGWQAWTLMAFYGIYYAFTDGVAKAFVADLVPSNLRGTAYGIFNAAIGVTAFPASLIAGILWQGVFKWAGFGPSAPFYFGATLSLLACALLLFAMPRKTELA